MHGSVPIHWSSAIRPGVYASFSILHVYCLLNDMSQFEELVDQFLPSDLTWRGWVRMAFHQPLVPVLPVARELFSKTKLIPSRNAPQNDSRAPSKKFALRGKKNIDNATIRASRGSSSNGGAPSTLALSLTGAALVDEPEATGLDLLEHEDPGRKRQQSRPRLLSVFVRGKNEIRSTSLPSVSSFFNLPDIVLTQKFISQENIARQEISYRIYEPLRYVLQIRCSALPSYVLF